jgi:hypothetical protein
MASGRTKRAKPECPSSHGAYGGFRALNSRPLEAIMRQTGHKTERVARGYIQHATVFVNNPAKGLV